MSDYLKLNVRDPFARITLRRRAVRTLMTCRWCGQSRGGRLWQHFLEADSPSRGGDVGPLVCSVDCLRSHQG